MELWILMASLALLKARVPEIVLFAELDDMKSATLVAVALLLRTVLL